LQSGFVSGEKNMGKLTDLKKNDVLMGQFVENCFSLLDYAQAHQYKNKIVYADEHIEVENNLDNKEFTITIFYRSDNGHEVSNPVFMMINEQEVIRTHGEWRYKKEHVEQLLKILPLYKKITDNLIDSPSSEDDSDNNLVKNKLKKI
jgi:hypothetical protein